MSEPTAEGLALFGQIVSANVAAASQTTNALLETKDEEILLLARTLVHLDEVLERATVIDRKTERALSHFEGRFDHARRILNRAKEQM